METIKTRVVHKFLFNTLVKIPCVRMNAVIREWNSSQDNMVEEFSGLWYKKMG